MIRILKKLFYIMRKFKAKVYIGIVLSLIGNILGAVPVICGAYTIRFILDDQSGVMKLDKSYALLLAGVIVASIVLRWLLSYLRAVKQGSIAYEVTAQQRLKIGSVLKRVSLGFLQKNNTGELNTAVMEDLAFFEMQEMNTINSIVDSYIFLLITVAFLFFFSPTIALAAVAAIIISFAGLQMIARQSRKNFPVRPNGVVQAAEGEDCLLERLDHSDASDVFCRGVVYFRNVSNPNLYAPARPHRLVGKVVI